MTLKMRVSLVTLVISVLVLGLKYLAFRYTGSVALYSDALESIVNVVTAIATLIAIAVSSKCSNNVNSSYSCGVSGMYATWERNPAWSSSMNLGSRRTWRRCGVGAGRANDLWLGCRTDTGRR